MNKEDYSQGKSFLQETYASMWVIGYGCFAIILLIIVTAILVLSDWIK